MGLAEFSRLFGAMSFSKHSCLVKDKPVQEWLAIVDQLSKLSTITQPKKRIHNCNTSTTKIRAEHWLSPCKMC